MGNYIWYELITPDPVAAGQFYKAVVGWDIAGVGTTSPDGSDYRMIKRYDGGNAGGVLTLTEAMQAHGMKPCWLGYIHVPDVDTAVQAITGAGGAVHMPPTTMDAGTMAMVSDPWGAVFYVMDPVPPPGQPDAVSDVFAPDKSQHMQWNELWSPDPEGAAAFYTALCGWTQDGEMDMGPMGTYRFLQSNGLGIGGIGKAQPEGNGPRWSYFIGVDDIDRAAAAVTAGGGTLWGEPHEVPGGVLTVYCTDPQGAAFGLVGPRN